MNKPRILLSVVGEGQNYVRAITQSGGVGVAMQSPCVDTDYDGLILCGGGDIDPAYYGEENKGSKKIDPKRDEAEFALLQAYVALKKPILGICRGFQLLNVYFGGTLVQDLTTAALHASFADYDLVHKVQAESDGLLGRLYGKEFSVNSYHHQGLHRLGDGLRLTARSVEDGVAEGIEHINLPIFGVQFHPERMCFEKRRMDAVDGGALLGYFLELCRKISETPEK